MLGVENGGAAGAAGASAAGSGTGATPFLLRHSLYFCAYCNKDISSVPRVRCAECGVASPAAKGSHAAGAAGEEKRAASSSSPSPASEGYDSCVECFAAGAALFPHRPGHAYRVVDDLSFPLFDPRWGADEEGLLLEGISMFGLGSWGSVADHVNAGGSAGGGGGNGGAGAAAVGANNCSNDAAIAAALAAGTNPAFLVTSEQQQQQQKNPAFKDAAACARHYFEAYLASPDFPRPAPLPSMLSAAAKAGGGGGAGAASLLLRRSSSKPPTRDKEGDMDIEGEDSASA